MIELNGISDLKDRYKTVVLNHEGENLRKLAIGENPNQLVEKLEKRLEDDLFELLALGDIPLLDPRVIKALNPDTPTSYFVVAKNYTELLALYGKTAFDLEENQAQSLASVPRNSAIHILDVLGNPENVYNKAQLERLAETEKLEHPRGIVGYKQYGGSIKKTNPQGDGLTYRQATKAGGYRSI